MKTNISDSKHKETKLYRMEIPHGVKVQFKIYKGSK